MKNIFSARFRADLGSGTILGLALMLLSLGILVASNFAVFRLFAAEKLQAQADQVAVSAADSLRGLNTGFPCEQAEQLAHIYMVKLEFCRIVGFECFLRLRSEQFDLVADARAGPPE